MRKKEQYFMQKTEYKFRKLIPSKKTNNFSAVYGIVFVKESNNIR